MWSLKAPYFSVCAVVLALAACSPLPVSEGVDALGDSVLIAGAPIIGDQSLEPLADPQILKLNQQMRDFLAENVPRSGRQSQTKTHYQLLSALFEEGGFELQYDHGTRTAAQTFDARSGNCLSFTSLFVVLARELGLDASFQEVKIPPVWRQDGDTMILSMHINVLMNLPKSQEVVDFDLDSFKSSYDRKVVSDKRARAHYYNNVGVEKMQQGLNIESFQHYQKGLQIDGRFAALWTNLGTLYRRLGHLAYAEASYMRALSIDRYSYVAMSHLQQLHLVQGNEEYAEYYRQRVIRHRNGNPYYHFQRGEDALLAKDYNSAISHLRNAIRKKEEEDSFYFLLGMVYLQKGEIDKGKKYLEQAVDIALDEDVKNSYRHKMAWLLENS